ncbi:MAG: RNA methyltransferase [Saprospiraceae bacterium]|nr:RNA methyltransferase [Saprospiraceae bacterium]
MRISPERKIKIEQVAKARQFDLTIVLENVHDPHNIGAVMRSCDAVGISEIFVLFTEAHLTQDRIKIGAKTSGGANKWLTIHYFRDRNECFRKLRETYHLVLAAMPDNGSLNLWSLDFAQPVAFVLGNEKDGVSDESQRLCDGNYFIPMAGMATSLNISVACAVTLYEAYRQRFDKGTIRPDARNASLLESYLSIHEASYSPKTTKSPKDLSIEAE